MLQNPEESNDDYITRTNSAQMFREQARFAFERCDIDLWSKLLGSTNPCASQLYRLIINLAPEITDAEHLAMCVRGFMIANASNPMIDFLEAILIHHPSPFCKNKNLQNLLIITAIKTAPSRVMGYLKTLVECDAGDLGMIARKAGLYEEAFELFKMGKRYVDAVALLLGEIGNLQRAQNFAQEINLPEVWAAMSAVAENPPLPDPEY